MFPCRYDNNNMLYTLVEMQRKALEPARVAAKATKEFYKKFFPDSKFSRNMAATSEMIERLTSRYEKPAFGITNTKIGGNNIKVEEIVILKKTFCNLLHFKKVDPHHSFTSQPKILLVAPMSGHYATLLRGTVEGLLPYADVYITDWFNVRDIPMEKGTFHFDDYVSYVKDFCNFLGSEISVIAVCQPSVPVLVAMALMSEEENSKMPKNIILMGGPIDTRKSPTEVNDYAAAKTIKWFEEHVITKVPGDYKGAGREVYPGFMQLSGFLAMNMQTHIKAHQELFYDLVEGDGEGEDAHKKFYNEYLAVMDLPAEFYLETVKAVFHEHLLPRGKLTSNGKKVNLDSITKPALLCIEGERDDISGRGQTKAAIALCGGIPDQRKHYHLQMEVGHYGIFNGRRYREKIVPLILDFIINNNVKKETTTMITKKTAVKKPAVKKPAAKKAAPKKTVAAKKPAVKKAAPKKATAVKKPAVKKPAAKKPAAKKATAVKKPAVKKTAPKKATATKKPAVKKPAAKKAAPKKVAPKK